MLGGCGRETLDAAAALQETACGQTTVGVDEDYDDRNS